MKIKKEGRTITLSENDLKRISNKILTESSGEESIKQLEKRVSILEKEFEKINMMLLKKM